MSELKPCPFCGKENTVAGSTERMILGWWYACEDCFENRKGGVHEDRWNTRPIEDALRKRIAELEAAQRWRVVADGELPDDDVEVFVLLYGSSVSTGKHYRNARHLDLEGNSYDLNYVIGDYWLIGDDETTCAQHYYNAVTHWMPLPQPPEVQQ